MIASGANVKTVQSQLGHKTATMTLDQYGHLSAMTSMTWPTKWTILFAKCAHKGNSPERKYTLTCIFPVELPGIEPVSGCWSLSRTGTELRNHIDCDSPKLTSVDIKCAQNVPGPSIS